MSKFTSAEVIAAYKAKVLCDDSDQVTATPVPDYADDHLNPELIDDWLITHVTYQGTYETACVSLKVFNYFESPDDSPNWYLAPILTEVVI